MQATVLIGKTATTVHTGVVTTLDAKVQAADGGGATVLPARIEGTILAGGVAGNLAMRFGTEVAGSSVTVLAGSTLTVWI